MDTRASGPTGADNLQHHDVTAGHSGGALVLRTQVFDAATLRRSLIRVAHEIVERNRGASELPIRADYVGKNLPTSLAEDVRVRLHEADDGDDGVELWGKA